jgi:hypothetical protein
VVIDIEEEEDENAVSQARSVLQEALQSACKEMAGTSGVLQERNNIAI